MTPYEVLVEARAKIADPKHWTKGDYAKDANGNTIGPAEANAACWCLQGAVLASDPSVYGLWVVSMLLIEQIPAGWHDTAKFNDHPRTQHAHVLALFDRAIEATKS